MSIYFKSTKPVEELLKTIRTYFSMVEKKEMILKRREYQLLLNAIPENQRRHFFKQIPYEDGIIKSA